MFAGRRGVGEGMMTAVGLNGSSPLSVKSDIEQREGAKVGASSPDQATLYSRDSVDPVLRGCDQSVPD